MSFTARAFVFAFLSSSFGVLAIESATKSVEFFTGAWACIFGLLAVWYMVRAFTSASYL